MAKRKTKSTPPHSEQPALRLEWRSPAELVENPANWRRHPEAQLSALTDVITDVGWAGACLLNERTGRLIDGHARRKVALDQGTEKVPVLVGDWTEEQERKILATLDPIAAMAEADASALDELLRNVTTDSPALQEMLDGLAHNNPATPEPGDGGDDFDSTPAPDGPTRTNVGELWVIGGKHRLLVGDCTVKENVERLMGGEKVGLCFTSPPYAQQRDYGDAAKEKVQDWHALMCGAFANLPMTDDGQVLVNLGLVHRDGEWVPYWDGWIEWMREQGWRRFGWYVWDQGSGLPGDWNGRFAPSHEWIFHFNKESKRPEKIAECDPRNVEIGKRATEKRKAGGVVTSMRGKDGEVKEVSSTERNSHKIPDSVIRISRNATIDMARNNHPATFPIQLPSLAIESWPFDVYDPFLGSGTTLVAAHRLGRTCYGCELEPKYADVILKRAEAEGLTVERDDG